MADRVTQAVILSAGLGARLRSITRGKIPKVMVPLGGKPLLEWHVERLRSYGIDELYINLFHLPEVVQNYFGDGSKWRVKIEYSVERPKILGTAGALKNFEARLGSNFFVCYGDTFNLINYAKMIAAYQRRRGAIALTFIGDNKHPRDSDLVAVDIDLRFLKIYPKPHTSLPKNYKALQALHIFNKRILDHIPAGRYYEIDHQLLPKLLAKGFKVYGYESQEYIKDIGTPDRYKAVQTYLRQSQHI